MTQKTKALQVAGNNLKGFHTHAIDSRMSVDNSIVSYRHEKGKVHNGMLQLQSSL
jgi:tRNA(Glu) U13 pseudouridine synthase TruD